MYRFSSKLKKKNNYLNRLVPSPLSGNRSSLPVNLSKNYLCTEIQVYIAIINFHSTTSVLVPHPGEMCGLPTVPN